jgi:hypothetical protein
MSTARSPPTLQKPRIRRPAWTKIFAKTTGSGYKRVAVPFWASVWIIATAIWLEHDFGARIVSYLMAHVELVQHRRKMRLFDVCTFFLVVIVCARRYPFPWRHLAAALIAKDRFLQISAVCDLLALLTACDYMMSRISGSSHHPAWISFLCAGYVSIGLIVTPTARSLIASIFLRKSELKRPAKRVLSSQ